MIKKYVISKNIKKYGYDEKENIYYYEKITKKIQCYSVTYRGNSNILVNNNRLIKLLWSNGIRYKTSEYFSKTRDDAGLPIYYTRITFYTDRNYIHNNMNHKIITWQKLENILKDCLTKI